MKPLSPPERALVESAMPMVRAVAKRVRRRFSDVPLEDFVSVGAEALVECVRQFDPSRGVPFEAFAAPGVRGDMLRKATGENFGELHVRIRRNLASVDPEHSPPPELGLAGTLEDTPEKARARAVGWIRRQAAGMFVSALGTIASEPEDGVSSLMRREERARARKALALALSELDEDERYLVERHYRDGATFEQLASELGVVKRTALRLHERVKDKLGWLLRQQGVDELPPSER